MPLLPWARDNRCARRALAVVLLLGLGACNESDLADPSGQDLQPPGKDADTSGKTPQSGKFQYVGGAVERAAPVASVIFSKTKLTEPAEVGEPSFDIGALRELHVQTVWRNLSGRHVELRRFYSPDGALYAQKLVPFATDISRAERYQPPVGIPSTHEVQPAPTLADGTILIWDYLPVGGTWIAQRNMVGTWRLEIALDPYGANIKGPVATFSLRRPN